MQEDISSQIPNTTSKAVCAVYTNYEGDYQAPYDIILGHQVSSLEGIPEGLVGQEIKGGQAAKFIAKGTDIGQAVGAAWGQIWQSPIKRAYQSDYELYASDFSKAAIFVGVQ